ncbi:MAG: DUF3631 domain-containing protein [Pseudomonadota bacterium]|nr:DUF3631 domain-containing protein [Pseudomonadota bacterium]MEE3101604.1 DUF3631 domain-containing protein [Pseudomonadota bacterium]
MARKPSVPKSPSPQETPPAAELEAELHRLARRPLLDYEKARKSLADAHDIRATALDRLMAEIRREESRKTARDVVENAEPWPHPAEGAALARRILATLDAQVVFASPHDAAALTLWIMGAWMMDASRLWPKLQLHSPTKRCGKTTLLDAIRGFARAPLATSSISAAARFRGIDAWQPTLLIDEADLRLRGRPDLNGILNAGHTRSFAQVIRVEEIDGVREPRGNDVFGAQVIAGIGRLPETIEDRSVRIGLRRKPPHERVAKLPFDHFERNVDVRRQLARWAKDALARIRADRAGAPPCGNDRAQDNWTPLFRVARALGDDWPERAAAAYGDMAVRRDADEPGDGVTLLSDLRDLFVREAGPHLATARVLEEMHALEERPRRAFRDGQPLQPHQLARLLKPFGISSKQVREENRRFKAWQRGPVMEAAHRYCGANVETPKQSWGHKGLEGADAETRDASVSARMAGKRLDCLSCFGVSAFAPRLRRKGNSMIVPR